MVKEGGGCLGWKTRLRRVEFRPKLGMAKEGGGCLGWKTKLRRVERFGIWGVGWGVM